MAPGVHAWLQPDGSWGESNACLVVGEGTSLLVDTLWDVRLTARMLDAMWPLVERAPIATVVNTHSDGDHWWGNQLVAGAEIVATQAAAGVMAGQSPAEMTRFGRLGAALRMAGRVPIPYPKRDDALAIGRFVGGVLEPFRFTDVRPTRPTRTFRGELALHVGGREVRLREVGPAHTPGDLVVHVPDARTVIAGDILFGFGDWLDPERAIINVRTIDAHRRGVARLPGPRDYVDAFSRMALLARDRGASRGS